MVLEQLMFTCKKLNLDTDLRQIYIINTQWIIDLKCKTINTPRK